MEDMIRSMEEKFYSPGIPRAVRSDVGPQFRSADSNWLAFLGMLQETSSPYNSASNGPRKKLVQDLTNIFNRQ